MFIENVVALYADTDIFVGGPEGSINKKKLYGYILCIQFLAFQIVFSLCPTDSAFMKEVL